MNLITTFTGKKIDIQNVHPDDISILDIVQGLSNLCRFAGQTRRFYSVAEHSIRVAAQLPPHLRLQGLLHDATEAYVVDLPSPIKTLLPEYKALELGVWQAISKNFGLPAELHPDVLAADRLLLEYELHEFFYETRPLEEVVLPSLGENMNQEFLDSLHRELFHK